MYIGVTANHRRKGARALKLRRRRSRGPQKSASQRPLSSRPEHFPEPSAEHRNSYKRGARNRQAQRAKTEAATTFSHKAKAKQGKQSVRKQAGKLPDSLTVTSATRISASDSLIQAGPAFIAPFRIMPGGWPSKPQTRHMCSFVSVFCKKTAPDYLPLS